MGITGSGKSTFISRCTGDDAAVGHGLQSRKPSPRPESLSSRLTRPSIDTRKVSFATITHKGRTVRLIDTPGFDDSDIDDSDIFKDISYWLLTAFSREPPLLLSGVIYLHPITNVRMKGTDKTSLAMFQALCGKESFSSVVLATTMWGKLDPATGNKRHATLSQEYWNDLADMGTAIVKHADTKSSALGIVEHIVQQNSHITLKIQQELSAGMELSNTDAGREISRKLNEARESAAKQLAATRSALEDAQARSDAEDLADIIESQAEYQRNIQAKELELERMKLDMEMLFTEKKKQLQEDHAETDAQREASKDRISRLTQELNAINASQQEAAAAPAKYDIVDFKTVDEQIKEQIKRSEEQTKLMQEKHRLEMEEERRHQETLRATKEGNKWGMIGASAGIGSAAIAAGSLGIAAAQACQPM